MGDGRITLKLDRYECGVIFHSLKDKRNQMLQENKETEAVDDVLLKVIDKMGMTSAKEKRGHKEHEER